MKATSISGHKQSLLSPGIDSQGKKSKLKPVTLTVAGNPETNKVIEISNIGHIIKSGQNLVTPYSLTDVYCALTDTALYTKLSTSYRGQAYFAAFTEGPMHQRIEIAEVFVDKAPRHWALTGASTTAI